MKIAVMNEFSQAPKNPIILKELRNVVEPMGHAVWTVACLLYTSAVYKRQYMPCVTLADGVPVIIELEEKDRFRLTPEKLLEKITDKTKILVLPFPNNPTGAIMEREDLEKLVDIIIEKDLFVVSDEIYSELTFNGKDHVTIASVPGMKMCIRDRHRLQKKPGVRGSQSIRSASGI